MATPYASNAPISPERGVDSPAGPALLPEGVPAPRRTRLVPHRSLTRWVGIRRVIGHPTLCRPLSSVREGMISEGREYRERLSGSTGNVNGPSSSPRCHCPTAPPDGRHVGAEGVLPMYGYVASASLVRRSIWSCNSCAQNAVSSKSEEGGAASVRNSHPMELEPPSLSPAPSSSPAKLSSSRTSRSSTTTPRAPRRLRRSRRRSCATRRSRSTNPKTAATPPLRPRNLRPEPAAVEAELHALRAALGATPCCFAIAPPPARSADMRELSRRTGVQYRRRRRVAASASALDDDELVDHLVCERWRESPPTTGPESARASSQPGRGGRRRAAARGGGGARAQRRPSFACSVRRLLQARARRSRADRRGRGRPPSPCAARSSCSTLPTLRALLRRGVTLCFGGAGTGWCVAGATAATVGRAADRRAAGERPGGAGDGGVGRPAPPHRRRRVRAAVAGHGGGGLGHHLASFCRGSRSTWAGGEAHLHQRAAAPRVVAARRGGPAADNALDVRGVQAHLRGGAPSQGGARHRPALLREVRPPVLRHGLPRRPPARGLPPGFCA